MSPFLASVVQASPVFFDKSQTLQKIGDLVRVAAKAHAKLILFPEVLIPGYPRGLIFGTTVGGRSAEGRELFLRYWENAIEVPGSETSQLAGWAKEVKAYVVVGVTEKDKVSDTLYCSLLYFSPEGELIHRHRKIKPTAAERIIWGEGDGSDLDVLETPLGKIGGLICWENYMPLARTALYEQGIEVYLAPTADCRDSWQATLTHISCEGRCFVLGCNQYLTREHYPSDLQKLLRPDHPSLPSTGGSVIISPLGKVLAGPVFDKEEILTAEIDHGEIIKAKMDFDVIGHYARQDVFSFEWLKEEINSLLMADQKNVIEDFYSAFQKKDWKSMQACYHDDVQFSDPVFINLKGLRAKAMWHMLTAAAKDLDITFQNVKSEGTHGSCQWDAHYTFSKTGRKVHNIIQANFEFRDQKIIQHIDKFDLWRWSGMALGISGTLFGWTPMIQLKIRNTAERSLAKFIKEHPEYKH